QAREPAAARAALRVGQALAHTPLERAAAKLEAGRQAFADGDPDRAAGLFTAAASLAHDDTLAARAWLEAGRTDEARPAWRAAADDDARARGAGIPAPGEVALREAFTALAAGDTARARAALAAADGEAATFWRAVVDRRADRARADSALAMLAARP